MPNYDYWQAALAGEKPRAIVDQCELGFYRKGVYQRDGRGNNKRVGWRPVAVFMNGDVMTARIGSANESGDIVGDGLGELWSYIAGNPISEEWYRAVAERGEPWPDAHDATKNKTGEPDHGPAPTIEAAAASVETPEQKLAREISELSKGVSQYGVIDSDTMAGQVLSLKNELTAEAGRLDKMREALVRPHIDAQKAINSQWNPVINQAKALCATLLGKIGVWEDTKRAIARAAQEKNDREAREHAERVRAAEDAGKPAPAPLPAPVAPNAPPPSTQVSAAVGRKASVKVSKFVTKIDLDKAFAQFRNEPAVNACLIALAQRAVDAGLSVDGAIIEERSVVR